MDKGLVIVLVSVGVVAAWVLLFAGDVEAVERPTDPGPYNAGYYDVTLEVTDERRPQKYNCRFYYPAIDEGEGADPDPTGAPYPPIIHHVYLPELPYLPDPTLYNRTCDRDLIEFVVSHGFIVVTYTPYKPVLLLERSFYNDLVNHTDSFHANASSPLYGMVRTEAYGAMGECRGGSLSFIHAMFTDRVTAVLSLGPWFGANDTTHPITPYWNDKDMAWMVQKGAYTGNEGYLHTIYNRLDPEKMMVTIPGGGQRGPFRLDLVVAFFHYYLGEEDEYGTFLNGPEAFHEALAGRYRLKYEMGDGEVKPTMPVFTLDLPSIVNMDEEVTLNVSCDKNPLWLHPELVHEWCLDEDSGPISSSKVSPNITYVFKGPATYDDIHYRYRVGEISNRSRPMELTVLNVLPKAGIERPGLDTTADVGSKIVFTGWGRDTPSDNQSLEYHWEFMDGTTAEGIEAIHAFREPGIYQVTLTVEDEHGAIQEVVRRIRVRESSTFGAPQAAMLTFSLITTLGIVLLTATEPGKYWLGLAGAPLFMKTIDIMDNKTRHGLLGIIITNPGIHFTAIKEEFNLSNGAAAYHLDVLERESFIKSVRDGKRKRFYSAYAKVPSDLGMSPEETRESIMGLVRRRPGISQLEVMDELGIDRDSASYYLRDLVKQGLLKAGREGKFTVYRVGKKAR